MYTNITKILKVPMTIYNLPNWFQKILRLVKPNNAWDLYVNKHPLTPLQRASNDDMNYDKLLTIKQNNFARKNLWITPLQHYKRLGNA